jgi:putative nucleotidyltransferase with HDIG domain
MLVEKRDPYTAGHQIRVGQIAYLIAKQLALSEPEAQHIRICGLLHDIGKIVVPIEILSKPGKLNVHEFDLIKTHPVVGYEILKEMNLSWPAAETVLQHHERLNGSGYPGGLKGREILFDALVLSVADVLEAKTSFRPYRGAMSVESVFDELLANRDILYDRSVVDACLKVCGDKKIEFYDTQGQIKR